MILYSIILVALPGPVDHNTDPHNLPDEVWRDPSLIGSNTTLVTSHQSQVLPIPHDGSVCMPYMVSHLPSTKNPVMWSHQSTINMVPSWDIYHT